MENSVIINARKYDGLIHRTWKANLLAETPLYWLFRGIFEKEIVHSELGIIKSGTISYEYYFKESCFNIFRFHQPTGEFRNYYCNLNLPPIFANNQMDYIDLDIDIVVWQDFKYEILDQDEFILNSNQMNYSNKMIEKIEETKLSLINLIERRQFPFDTFHD